MEQKTLINKYYLTVSVRTDTYNYFLGFVSYTKTNRIKITFIKRNSLIYSMINLDYDYSTLVKYNTLMTDHQFIAKAWERGLRKAANGTKNLRKLFQKYLNKTYKKVGQIDTHNIVIGKVIYEGE